MAQSNTSASAAAFEQAENVLANYQLLAEKVNIFALYNV